jgi:hypoxanthine phosphoribosyltransferase
MADLPRCRQATWKEVEVWADRVADRVRDAAATPDTIVALSRGGWVPGRLLCDRLGVHRLLSLRAQHWGVTARPSGQAELTEGLSGHVTGQSVLVVDDITDTGESLALAVEHVRADRPSRLESAALLHIEHAKFVPTYYAEMIPRAEWVWVVFPWNYWEDLATLAARAAEVTPGIDGIQRTLRERTGLIVPRADLLRVASRTSSD